MNRSNVPVLSVVIPAYNNASTLAEAIASVRSQDVPCPEIIVVDDGSSDATNQVIDDLAGHDLRLIRQPNGGPGAARNTGITAARGEWIAFLDGDDLWLPSKLELQLAAIWKDPNVALLFHRFCHSAA